VRCWCSARCEPRGKAGDHGTSYRLTGLPLSPAGTNSARPTPTPHPEVPSLVTRYPASLIPDGHCPYARRTGCGCFPMPTCNSGWPRTWLDQVPALGAIPATTHGPTLRRQVEQRSCGRIGEQIGQHPPSWSCDPVVHLRTVSATGAPRSSSGRQETPMVRKKASKPV
jgi:hypothetical protein